MDNPGGGGGGGAEISGVGGMATGDVTCSASGDVTVSERGCVVIGVTVGGGAAAWTAAAAAAAYLIGGKGGAVDCRGTAGETSADPILFSDVVRTGLLGVSTSLTLTDGVFSLSVVFLAGVFLASKGLVGAGAGSSDTERVLMGVAFAGG